MRVPPRRVILFLDPLQKSRAGNRIDRTLQGFTHPHRGIRPSGWCKSRLKRCRCGKARVAFLNAASRGFAFLTSRGSKRGEIRGKDLMNYDREKPQKLIPRFCRQEEHAWGSHGAIGVTNGADTAEKLRTPCKKFCLDLTVNLVDVLAH